MDILIVLAINDINQFLREVIYPSVFRFGFNWGVINGEQAVSDASAGCFMVTLGLIIMERASCTGVSPIEDNLSLSFAV